MAVTIREPHHREGLIGYPGEIWHGGLLLLFIFFPFSRPKPSLATLAGVVVAVKLS
jgi:hypothetical protein